MRWHLQEHFGQTGKLTTLLVLSLFGVYPFLFILPSFSNVSCICRKYLAELFNNTSDHLYYPPRNWTFAVREHLNKSLAEEGLLQESNLSKTKFFLSHPIPECSCSTVKATDSVLFEGQDDCPKWMQQLKTQETNADEVDSQEDETDSDGQSESERYNGTDAIPSLEQDEEMDPDD